MSNSNNNSNSGSVIAMTRQQFMQTVMTGLVVGLVVWGLSLLLEMYVFEPLLCRSGDGNQCGATLTYAGIVANGIGLGIGVSGLVYFRVFRPLLVGLATMLTLWSLTVMTADWVWYLTGFAVVALYAVAYALYGWVARLKSFWVALAVSILLVAITRLVITS